MCVRAEINWSLCWWTGWAFPCVVNLVSSLPLMLFQEHRYRSVQFRCVFIVWERWAENSGREPFTYPIPERWSLFSTTLRRTKDCSYTTRTWFGEGSMSGWIGKCCIPIEGLYSVSCVVVCFCGSWADDDELYRIGWDPQFACPVYMRIYQTPTTRLFII